MEGNSKSVSIARIITSILFLILGVALITRPILSLGALIWIFGAILSVGGIINLITCIISKENMDYAGGKGIYIVLCILRIIVGIIFVADEFLFVGMLPYLIAGWLIIATVFKIAQAFMMKKNGVQTWYAQLICAIFYALMGVLLLTMGVFAGAQFVGIVAGISILVSGVTMLCEPLFKGDDDIDRN